MMPQCRQATSISCDLQDFLCSPQRKGPADFHRRGPGVQMRYAGFAIELPSAGWPSLISSLANTLR